MIDGSMASTGGGFTYPVNLLPELARLAPADRFRVFVADRRLADAIPEGDNLHVEFLGQLAWRQRLRFTYLQAPRRAAEWKAAVYFSVAQMASILTWRRSAERHLTQFEAALEGNGMGATR